MKRSIITSFVALLVIVSMGLGVLPVQAAGPIYVHGDIVSSVTWTSTNLYILDGDLNVINTGVLAIQAGTQVKVQPGFALNVYGKIILQGTSGNPVVFTSNRDNTVGGDTDPGSTPPSAGDWKGLLLQYSNGVPGATDFQYTTVHYATTGLHVQNISGNPINPLIANDLFELNQTGLLLEASDGDINSNVQANQISQNITGAELQSTGLGLILINLANNAFNANTTYPLLMRASSFPTFSGNTFTANGNQGLGVADVIDLSGVWVKVPANPNPGAPILPYLIESYVEIVNGTSLQIPAGLVIKGGSNALIEVYGQLLLQGTSGEKVVFTSIHDDSYGGDSDGHVIDPATDPWSGLELFNSGGLNTTNFAYTIFRYSSSGLMITNAAATPYSPTIQNNTFDLNGIGINMLVASSANMQSTISNNTFSSNQYGIATTAGVNYTGNLLPNLQNNTFSANTVYPILLQGSCFPTYSGNTFNGNLHPGIGVQGKIHMNGTWAAVPGQAGINLPYVLTANYTVPASYTLTLPPGTVVKSGSPSLDVTGGVLSLSASGDPVIFTSLNDSTVGGVTAASTPLSVQAVPQPSQARAANTPARLRLGEVGFQPPAILAPLNVTTAPQPGDWAGVTYSGNATVQNAVFRYGVYGVRVTNTGNTAVTISIHDNTFDRNQTSIDFNAPYSGGDIHGTVQNNQIVRSRTGVKFEWLNNYLGSADPALHNNNITVNAKGVDNLQTNVTVDATNNWWGDPSGPYNPLTNADGYGDPVSDSVTYNPWLGQPPFPPLDSYVKTMLPLVQK